MLSQKIKKVVSVLLIASMTFTSAGFSVLANSVDDVVQNIEDSESQKEIKNYYLEYKQYEERTVIVTTKNSDDGSNANGDNAGSVDNKNQIANSNGENEAPSINSAEEDEGDTTKNKNYAEEPEEAEKKSSDAEEKTDKENSENENANSENEKSENENLEKENSGNDNADAEKTGNNSENEGSNNEATEKSQSSDEEKNNDETNNETNKIDEEETTTEVEATTEETTTVESTTVESTTEETTTEETTTEETTTEETTTEEASTEQTTETTTTEVVDEEKNKKEKVDAPEESTESQVTISNDDLNNVDDIKNNKSNINFVDATDSETSKEVVVVKKYIYATRSIPEDSVWTLKEILANDASASFKTIPNTETIKEKYLAKNIKVLLVNQYGDEKVVTVPATWNVEFYSKVYFPEGYVPTEKNYESDAEGNLTITDKDGNVEIKKASESDIDANVIEETVDANEDDDNEVNNIEGNIKGFTGTEEENFGGSEKTGNIDNKEKKDATDDDHDVAIDDKEVVVEIEEIDDDRPIKVDDEELTKKNALLGNANTNIVNKESAKEEAAAILDMEELMKSLAIELGTPVKTGGKIVPYDIPIFGATPTGHAHWVCGRLVCSDTVRNHFNENMDTKHSYTGSHDYQAISNLTQLEQALAQGDGDSDYDFLYLTADIQVNKMIKVYRQLFICLNQHTLSFTANGQLCTYYNVSNPTLPEAGTYPYGITFCGCEKEGAISAGGYCGTISGGDVNRTAPAIFYTKAKGVYFYGLGNESTVNAGDVGGVAQYTASEKRLKITGFKTALTSYKPRKGQVNSTAASDHDVYAWPNNHLYNGAPGMGTHTYYQDQNSTFLTVSVNGTDQAANQTQTEAFFYALDISDITSNDGGFANLYYVNSFAMEHCKVDNVKAFRGGVVTVDYGNKQFFDTSSGASPMNAYIDIAHNSITNCGLMSQTSDTWGTEGKYSNGTKVDTSVVSSPVLRDNKVFSPDANGLFLLENYDGGSTLQDYRTIRGNIFNSNNLSRVTNGVDGYLIYLTLESQGANTTNIKDNKFTSNGGGVLYVENTYNDNHGTTDQGQGTINFDNNTVRENALTENGFTTTNRPNHRAVLQFKDLSKVYINTSIEITAQEEITRNYGIGTGAVSILNVERVAIYKTNFNENSDNNAAPTRAGQLGAGAIFLSSCSEVDIGHPNINQTYKVSFINNSISKNGGLGDGAGAIFARDVKSLNISDTSFSLNTGKQGGAVGVDGVASDIGINIYGSSFIDNVAEGTGAKGGAIYFKGDDAKTHSNKFYTSYYLADTNRNQFINNTVPVNADGGAIYIEKMTQASDIKYALINNPLMSAQATYRKNEIAIKDSTARLAVMKTDIEGNGTGNSITDPTVRKAYSTIYVENAEFDFDAGAKIRNNLNPIRLSNATLSMVSYNFLNHGRETTIDAVPDEDDIVVFENKGDYVIGVDNDSESNIFLKQGMFINNTELLGKNREGSTVNVGDISYDGMFGYIGKSTTMVQSNIYLGGNVHVKNNSRTGGSSANTWGNANMPLEAVDKDGGESYSDPTKRHFNHLISMIDASDFKETDGSMLTLKDGVEDVRLGINAKVILSIINSVSHNYGTPAKDDTDTPISGTETRAAEIRLFAMDTDTATDYIKFNNQYIQRYDNGSGGAIPTQIFDTDTYQEYVFNGTTGSGTLYDNRVVFFEIGTDTAPINKVYVSDKEELTDFEFEMIFPTTDPGTGADYVRPIPNQRVRNGQTLLRPIMDYSIAANSTQAIYTSSGNYKVIDVAGNLDFNGTNPRLRFHSWNWSTTITNAGAGAWNPKLYAIYANVNHEHRACGTPNDESCNHIGYTGGNHKAFGGDIFGTSEEARSKTCVDVRDPRQLFYMAEKPQYMYVLGADLVIPDQIDGVSTDQILNDESLPIRGINLCLNGHTLTVANGKTLFAVYEKCFITDCSQNSSGTIKFSDTSLTDVNIIKFIASGSIVNELYVNGGIQDENKRLTFTDFPVHNDNQSFAEGLRDGEPVYMSRVAFNNNNVQGSILKTKGLTALADVDFVGNTINAADKPLVSIEESATKNQDITISGGKISSNSVLSNNTSVLKIKAKKLQTNVNFTESENSTGDDIEVKYNKLTNRAAIYVGDTAESDISLSMADMTFEKNYVENSTTVKKGAGLFLNNIYSNNVTFENLTFESNGINVLGGIAAPTTTNNYAQMNTNQLYGAGMYVENNVKTALTNTNNLQYNFIAVKFNRNVANRGAGIYLKDIVESSFDSSCEFVGNAASDGAAIYFDASDKDVKGRGSVNFESVNILNNGAILTNTDAILPMYKQAETEIASIDNNMKTGSVIYFAAIGSDPNNQPINMILENPNVKYNYAKEGVVKFGNVDTGNGIRVSGNTQAEFTYNGLRFDGGTHYKYYGGPVIAYANAEGYDPIFSFEADSTINTRVKWNFVGDSKAIINGVTDANPNNPRASASMAFSGKLEIRDNFDTNNREANLRVRSTFAFDADQSLDPANTFVFFTSDDTEHETLTTKWNYNAAVFALHPVLEHYYSDAYCPTDGFPNTAAGNPGFTLERAAWANNENDIVVYKGANTNVYVGAKKFANPVYVFNGMMDYGTIHDAHPSNDPNNADDKLAFWGRNGDVIKIDQYDTTGIYSYRVYNGFKKYGNKTEGTYNLTAGNFYVAKDKNNEYKTWGFTNNSDYMEELEYKVNTGRAWPIDPNGTIDHFDYIYYTSHGAEHNRDTNANTRSHGSFNTNFVYAYSEVFLYASYPDSSKVVSKNNPGITNVGLLLSRDISLNRALVNKKGTNICLNGHNLRMAQNDNLVRLNANDAQGLSLAILDCSTSTDHGLFGSVQTSATNTFAPIKPMFELTGLNQYQPSANPALYIEGVNILGLNYTGSSDGAIIKASYSSVVLMAHTDSAAPTTVKNTVIRKHTVGVFDYPFVTNGKTPIDLLNSRVTIKNVTISGMGTSASPLNIGDNGFIYMHGSDSFNDESSGTIKHWNGFEEAVDSVNIHDMHFNSNRAFFNLEDAYSVNNSNYEIGTITFKEFKVSANDYTDMNSETSDAIKYSGVNNYKANAKGALIYINNPNEETTVARGLTIDDSTAREFIRARVTGVGAKGAAIYVEDFANDLLMLMGGTGRYYTVTLNKAAFKYNESNGDGGAIYFNTSATYRARLRLELIDVNEAYCSTATGNGGFMYLAQTRHDDAYPDKNLINIRTSTEDAYMQANNASNGRGGVIYVTDTLLTMNGGTHMIYAGQDTVDANRAIEGGMLWQKRTKTVLSNVNLYNNNTTGAGASIYVDGSEIPAAGETRSDTQVHDSLTLGLNGGSVQTFANTSGNNGGLVLIGTYSDLIFDGAVKLWDAGTKTAQGHTADTHVLYIKGENFYTQDLTNLGVERYIDTHFDYTNSYVYGFVEKIDRLFISGFDLANHTNMNANFAPALTLDPAASLPMSIYGSGEASSTNVHIGYVNARFSFITFLSNGKAKVLADESGNPYTYEVSQGSARSLGSAVRLASLSHAAANATGYPESKLLGFVAYTSDVTGNNQKFKIYDPADYIYSINEENYVIAVWKSDETTNAKNALSAYVNNVDGIYKHVGNMSTTHDSYLASTFEFANVETYQQLHLGKANVGYYLKEDVQDTWMQLVESPGTVPTTYNPSVEYTVENTTALSVPLAADDQVIYTSGKSIFKDHDTTLYNNPNGRFLFYTNTGLTTMAGIRRTSTTIMTNDIINAKKLELIGPQYSSAGHSFDIRNIKFDAETNVKFINMDNNDPESELYMLGFNLYHNENVKILAPSAGSSYIYDFHVANNTNTLPIDTSINDAVFTFKEVKKVEMQQSQAPGTTNNFELNTARNLIRIEGEYVLPARPDDPVFDISGLKFTNNTGDLNAATSSIIEAVNNSSTEEQIISIKDSVFTANIGSTYKSLITSYGHMVKLTNTSVTDNVVANYIIEQKKAADIDSLQFRLSDVTMTNNTLGSNGVLVYQDYADQEESGGIAQSINLINNSVIKDNRVNAAFFNSDGPVNYTLGGKTEIKDNRDASNVAHNLVINDSSNERQTVTFFNDEYGDIWSEYTSSALLSTASYIGVTAFNWGAEAFKTVAYQTWLANAKDTNAVFNKIFHSDDATYIFAKRMTSLILIRDTDTNLVKTIFDKNDSAAVFADATQYLYIDDANNIQTSADAPKSPTSAGINFLDWRDSKYLSDIYSFSDGNDKSVLEGEGTPRIATIYALWDKKLKVKIHTNNGGVGMDGQPLSEVRFSDGTNTYEVDDIYVHVPMGHSTIDATKITFTPVGETTEHSIDGPFTGMPRFTRVGMNSINEYYTKNGWTGRYGEPEGTWLPAWNWNGTTAEDNVIKEMTLYVRWVGTDFTMSYEYYDYDQDHPDISSGSTVVVNYYGGLKDETSTQYYGSSMMDGTIFTPVRHGYNFINWHSSPSNLFSDANIATSGTVYLWQHDVKVYAEWEPVDYTIKYQAKDGEVNDETDGHTAGVATMYEATLTFDMGRDGNNPDYEMKDNRFFRDGYTLLGWDYEVPARSEEGYITFGQRLGNLNLYNSFIDESFNPPKASPDAANFKPAVLKPDWHANKYRLIFDFNDGSQGNSDVYTGTTYVATVSALDPTQTAPELADLAYDATNNYFYLDVTYDSELLNNDQNVVSLPSPKRYGYTFEGWYQLKNSTTPDMEVTESTKYNWHYVNHDHDTDAYIKATDSKIYAKWRKNKYNLRFVAKDPSDQTVVGTITGNIPPINDIEFDTNLEYKIPAVRTTNTTTGEYEYKYQIDGYTYLGASLSTIDPVDSHVITIDVRNTKDEIVISSVSAFRNLTLAQIEDGETLDIIGNWEPHHYKIEYHANEPAGTTLVHGDTITTSSDIRYDDTTVAIWMPTEQQLAVTGYKFLGWATKSDADPDERQYEDGTSYTANRLASEKEGILEEKNDNEVYKLYAVWMKSPYYVTFAPGKNDNGKTLEDIVTVTGTMDTQAFETDGAAKKLASVSFVAPGHEFLYWKDIEYNATVPNPKGQWLATYSDAKLIDHNIRIGSNSAIVEAPFEGYWHEFKYTIKFDIATPVSPKAGEINKATGSRLSKVLAYSEEFDLVDDDPTLGRVMFPGYEFAYWTDPSGKRYNDEDTVSKLAAESVDNDEIVLTYHWNKKEVEVTLDYNDGEGNDAAFNTIFDATYSVINPFPTITRVGYAFDTWSKVLATPYETIAANNKITNNDIVRDVIMPKTAGRYDPDGDIEETLYAHWKHVNYNLTLAAGEVTGVAGLAQKGTMSSTNKATSSKIVRYDRPIGEDCGPDGSTVYGPIRDLDTTRLAGYKFVSYAYNGDEFDKNTIYDVAGDRTLTAEWEPITYTVHYNPGTSTTQDPVENTMADSIGITFDDAGTQFTSIVESDMSTTFKKRGFTFDYWTNDNYGVETLENVNSKAVVKATYSNGDDIKNLTELQGGIVNVTAVWKEHEYDIIFNSNAPTNSANIPNIVSGTMPNQHMKYTATRSLTTNTYTVPGYTFKGWSLTAGNNNVKVYDDHQDVSRLTGADYGTYGEDKEITLYAVWEANKYYVNFSLNDVNENHFGTTTASFIDIRTNKSRSGGAAITDHTAFVYEMTYDEPIGNDIGATGAAHAITGLKIKAGNRIGYDFVGWVATTSVADPTSLRRSDRQSSNELATTLFRATHSITYYALWSNIKYDIRYNTQTRNYGAGAPVANPTTGIVYFDCALGSDGELNATKSNISEISRVNGNQYAFQGWYYDQTWWTTPPVDPSGYNETASPSRTTKVDKNTVFDYNLWTYPGFVSQEGTASRNVRVNAYCAGLSQKLFVNPKGGSLWWGLVDPNETVPAKQGHRTINIDGETDELVLQVVRNDKLNDTTPNGVIRDDGYLVPGSLLPENKTVNPAYTPESNYKSFDGKDPVYYKGHIFKGWYTNTAGAVTPDEVTGSLPYWSDSQDSHIEARWEAKKFQLEYDANIPMYDDDGDGVYERPASTQYRLEWIVPGSPDPVQYPNKPANVSVTYGELITPAVPGQATLSTPKLPGYEFLGWYLYYKDSSGHWHDTTYDSDRIDDKDFTWLISEEDCHADTPIVCDDSPTGEQAVAMKLKAKWRAKNYKIVYHPGSGTHAVDAAHPYGDDGDTEPSFELWSSVEGTQQYYRGLNVATVSVTFDNKISQGVTPGSSGIVANVPFFRDNSRDGYKAAGVYHVNGRWPIDPNYDPTTWALPIRTDGETRYDTDLIRDIDPITGAALDTYNFWLINGYVHAYTLWYPKEVPITWDANKGNSTTNAYVKGSNTTYENYILYGDQFGTLRSINEIAQDVPAHPFDAIIFGYGDGTRMAGYELDIDAANGKYGWNTKADGTGLWINTMSTSSDIPNVAPDPSAPDVTKKFIYAQWKPRKYGIRFIANDRNIDEDHGSTAVDATTMPTDVNDIEFDSDIQASVFTTPTRPGYTFDGWYTSDGCAEGSWNGNWGTKVEAGMKYNFNDTNGALKSLTTDERQSFENPSYNYTLTLYARWRPNQYTVHFYLNDVHRGHGSTEAKLSVNGTTHTGANPFDLTVFFDHSVIIKDYINGTQRTNAELPVAANLSRPGYTINTDYPWSLNEGGTDQIENIFRESVHYDVVGDTNYFAKWVAETWTVKFSQIVNERYKPHAGYNAMPHLTDDDTIDSVNDKTVVFDSPVGVSITDATTLRSRPVGAEDDVIGYNFDKWYLDTTLTNTYFDPNDPTHRVFVMNKDILDRTDITIDKVMRTVTLYPTFTEKSYKITFNSNYTSYDGGVGSDEYIPSLVRASYNQVLVIEDPATHGYAPGMAQNGFEFTGWSLSPTPLAQGVLPEYPANDRPDVTVLRLSGVEDEEIVLYAHWRKERFNIKYENNLDDRPWSDVTVRALPTWYDANGTEFNLTIPGLGDEGAPKMTGAEFKGWTYTFYTNKDYTGAIATTNTTTEAIDTSIINPVSGFSLVLTANWKVITGQLIVDPNGGLGNTVFVDLDYLDMVVSIPPVSFTFEGMYIDHYSIDANDRSGIVIPNGGSIRIVRESLDDDYYVYAIWKKNTDGGSTDNSGSFYNGDRTSVGNRSYRGGGGGGGGGGGRAAGGATNLTELNTFTTTTAIERGAQISLALGLPSGSVKNVGNGNWNYDPIANAWEFILPLDNIQATIGANLKADLRMVAAGGLYTLPTGDVNNPVAVYMFDNVGHMLTGLQTYENNIYYFAPTGEMLFGWQSVNGVPFYFHETQGKLTV